MHWGWPPLYRFSTAAGTQGGSEPPTITCHDLPHPPPPHTHTTLACLTGGIKLHLELSLLLGTAAETFLQWAVSFYTWSWPWLGPAALLAQAAAAATGGASRGCVAAADILLVLLWPLVVLFVLCAHVHRLQLRCLAATWRLIRGKQQVRMHNWVGGPVVA